MGEAVIMDHGNGEYSVYAHLQPGSIRVKPGDKVEPHLHFQVCGRAVALSCAVLVPAFDHLEIANSGGRALCNPGTWCCRPTEAVV